LPGPSLRPLITPLGKAPNFGLMTDEGRKAKWLIEVTTTDEPQWSVLGGAIGMKVMEDVPFVAGIDRYLGQVDSLSCGKLKDMGAATATNGAVGLYHVENINGFVKPIRTCGRRKMRSLREPLSVARIIPSISSMIGA